MTPDAPRRPHNDNVISVEVKGYLRTNRDALLSILDPLI